MQPQELKIKIDLSHLNLDEFSKVCELYRKGFNDIKGTFENCYIELTLNEFVAKNNATART